MATVEAVMTRIVSAQLAEEDAARLEQLAEQADRSLSAEIRRAVREHLERTSATVTTTEEEGTP